VRVSKQEETERKGLRNVCDDFEAIGWGPVRNADHDLGTDLLVQARDERRFDRGLIVGVQVKAGPSRFRRRKRDKGGRVLGWWYYEPDAKHFDDWVTHSLPHLLVLHCLKECKSYWVHVTANRVARTRRGCKILVPADQTIDEDHAGELFTVACAQKAAPVIEGTALSGLPGGIPPARRLRYALVAPRLVAPNPNAGQEDEIDPVGGVALLAQGRFFDLVQFAEKHESVPDPRQLYSGPDWGWLFVVAIWDWALTDSVERLEAAFAAARSSEAAAASGVVLACALHRLERCDRALEVLEGLVDGDDLSPVDHGWVLVQRARFRTEVGDFDAARRDAIRAQRCFLGDRDDITASALAAAAAWQLYAAACLADPTDWAERHRGFDELVTAADTAVSWWRAQTVSWGLGRVEKTRFETWADPYPRYLLRWERPRTQELFAAEFSADITGEHSSWKQACALYGRQRLVDASDAADETLELVEGLRALRRSGDNKSLQKAIRRLRYDGPIGPVAEAVNEIPSAGWTHTTCDTNFATLAGAGDLVKEASATDLICWLAGLVEDPVELTEGLKPSRTVPMAALEAVTGLLPAAGHRAHTAVARLIAELPEPPPYLTTQQVSQALDMLDYCKVDEEARDALWEKARVQRGWIAVAALGWLADNRYAGAEAEAISRAVAEEIHAIEAVADLPALSRSEAVAVIDRIADEADQILTAARRGTYGGDGIDAAYWLAAMSLEFSDHARWDKVLEVLLEPRAAGHHKRAACLLMAQNADRLPTDVRSALAANTALVAKSEPGIGLEADIGGIETVLGIVLGMPVGQDDAAAMAKLAVGTPEQRRDAAMLLGWGQQPHQQPLLAALSADPHPQVRHEAARAIGKLAVADPSPAIRSRAWELADEDGILLPAALLSGLAQASSPTSDIASEIAQHLHEHLSAIIRRWTRRILR